MKKIVLTLSLSASLLLAFVPAFGQKDGGMVEYASVQTLYSYYNRGFILQPSMLDTVPLNGGRSGTNVLGLGFMTTDSKNRFGIQLAVEYAELNLHYKQDQAKTFPTATASTDPELTYERHSMTSVQVPLSLIWNFVRNEELERRWFLEAGGYVGWVTRGQYYSRYNDGNLEVRNELHNIQRVEGQFERFRYGLNARIGWRFIALYSTMRLNPVFGDSPNVAVSNPGAGFQNPAIPPLEIGFSFNFSAE